MSIPPPFGSVGGLELVNGGPAFDWQGLDISPDKTTGYRLCVRIIADAVQTQASLEVNGSLVSNTCDMLSVLASDVPSVQATAIPGNFGLLLNQGVNLGVGNRLSCDIDIPIVKQDGTGFNIGIHAFYRSTYVVAGAQWFESGSGRFTLGGLDAPLNRLRLLNTSGSFGRGSMAALYRLTR